MNIDKLINKYENECFATISTEEVLQDLKKLHEEQITFVPQFIAKYIELKKKDNFHVYGAMRTIEDYHDERVSDWFYGSNTETFIRAWMYGYRIKDKKYKVKLKGVHEYNECLYFGLTSNSWILASETSKGDFRRFHTEKELKDGGFAEVFNNTLFEVTEVIE